MAPGGPQLSAPSPASASDPSNSSNDVIEGRLLDGFLLLAAGGSLSPDDAITVNLSSLNLVDVASEDLAFFVNLDRLDASDNQLSYDQILAQLSRLPRLTTLNLACNSIPSLQVPPTSLRKLQALDLSFNELRGDVLVQLAQLSSLVTLNLTSNCISSVPPEEDLYGLEALEELILDQNDLVQFVQWRALDALPRLKKLSLSSNRIKKLRDDLPDMEDDSSAPNYFPRLEALDLSRNEIASFEHLLVVKSFFALRSLDLSDNPCVQDAGVLAVGKRFLRNVSIVSENTKPWYLLGHGCHQIVVRPSDPKLKLDRKKMRKVHSHQVSSSPVPCGQSLVPFGQINRSGGSPMLGVLDDEENRLVVNLHSGDFTATTSSKATRGMTYGYPAQAGARFSLAAQPECDVVEAAQGILCDEISEQELRAIFAARRAKIERKFRSEEADPVGSFMRPAPFAISAAAGRKLGLVREEEEEAMGTPSQSAAFLTAVGEDVEGGMRGGALQASHAIGGGAIGADRGGAGGGGVTLRRLRSRSSLVKGDAAATPSGSSRQGSATPAAGGSEPSGGVLEVSPINATITLPSIYAQAGVRDPVADAQMRMAAAVAGGGGSDFDIQAPRGATFGAKPRPMVDVGVREAMRALRAAALSDFAVH